MPYSKIPAFAHLTHSDAQGRSREGCHEPNSPFSRIGTHLVRLEEVNKEVLPTAEPLC